MALLVAFTFSGCINVLMLATPAYKLQVFETDVPAGSVETLILLAAMAWSAVGAAMLVELARDWILLRTGLWRDHKPGQHQLKNGLMAALAPADMRAEAKARAILRAFSPGPHMTVGSDVPWTPIFLGALALLHPPIGLIALGASLLLAAVPSDLQRDTRAAAERAERIERNARRSASRAALLNQRSLDAFGPARDVLRRLERVRSLLGPHAHLHPITHSTTEMRIDQLIDQLIDPIVRNFNRAFRV